MKLSTPGRGMAWTLFWRASSSGQASTYMGTLLPVSQWDSMAASLAGWYSATIMPC